MKAVGEVFILWQNGWAFVALPLIVLMGVVAAPSVVALVVWFVASFLMDIAGRPEPSPWPFALAGILLLAPFWARQLWPWIQSADTSRWNT